MKTGQGKIEEIAAGIGDVIELQKECDSKEEAYNKCYLDYRYWKDKAKEYKHRAERAERALDLCTKDIYTDTSGCCGYSKYDTSKEDAARAEKLKKQWINKAEKELQEERKDEKD